MYTPDIIKLRDFYSTPFGEAVRLLIDEAIAELWQESGSESLLGMGYAVPYLERYLGQEAPLAVVMPASQGAIYWPQGKDNLVLIAHDSELPFAESSVDRVLLVHSIENSEQLSWLIREIWRILTPNGKVLAVVPNRLGVWSRSSRSPFGYGRPFSAAQLGDLFSGQQFTVTRTRAALFMPPVRIKFLWRFAGKIEKIGRAFARIFGNYFGGVILIEAEKQLYAAIPQPVVEARNYRAVTAAAKAAMNKG